MKHRKETSKMIISRAFLFLFVLQVATNVSEVNSANILFYFGSSLYSHRVAVWPLVEKLAENGHQITFLSPFLPETSTPNVIEFRPKALVIYWRERDGSNKTVDVITSRIKGSNDGSKYWNGALQNGLEICRVIFRSSEVQKWAEDSEFDLVIIDTPFNECALALAFKLNAPHILYGSQSLYMWHQEMFGLPDETSWLPDYENHFPSDMTFFQRIKNVLTPLKWFYSTNRVSYILPQLEQLMRKSLNITEMPTLDELEKGTSLFLLNAHFSQEYPRSLPPFVVPVGGMHCKLDAIDLPEDISNFLDKYGQNGFVYMSFGSLVEVSKADSRVIENFMNAFKALDYPILWKWDDKIPENVPEKVFMANWFPQNQLLAHPNLKIFITSAGVLSYQEAIYHGVPMIAFPLNPEEDFNSNLIEKSVAGIRLEIAYFTQYELASSVKKIIADETYRSNINRLSTLFKDRPQNPTSTAVWWTEYVLRHKNMTFVKTPAMNQSWYQRRSLDVWGFLSIALIASFTVLVICINYIFCTKPLPPKPMKSKLKMS